MNASSVSKKINPIEIKKWLIRGDLLKIKKTTGKTPEYISSVLRGKAFNEGILDAAWDIAMERKAKWVNRIQRLKDLK